jgi:Carboxypeptidase regulatory-like domain
MAQVQGLVVNIKGYTLADVDLTFFHKLTAQTSTTRSGPGGDFRLDLAPGPYVIVAFADGYAPEESELDVPAGGVTGVVVTPTQAPVMASPPLSPPVELPDEVEEFLDKLDQSRFSLDAPVSLFEANQAVGLFSVVNLMLAGQGVFRLQDEERMDMLGVLTLFYRLSDKSLSDQLVVQNTDLLWRSIEDELKALANQVDQLQVDREFLRREAKRQFNLGTSNDVLANTEFPEAFDQYVDLAAQPVLGLHLKQEEASQFTDKLRLQQAYAVLRDLKTSVLQIVRMLSKYGTAATRRVNEDWAHFESRAIDVLATVAANRVSEDEDDKTAWNVLAVLTGRRREDLIPQIALARHGTKLLRLAIEIYVQTLSNLDATDDQHLRDLFQADGDESKFFTTRLRREADVLKRNRVRLT